MDIGPQLAARLVQSSPRRHLETPVLPRDPAMKNLVRPSPIRGLMSQVQPGAPADGNPVRPMQELESLAQPVGPGYPAEETTRSIVQVSPMRYLKTLVRPAAPAMDHHQHHRDHSSSLWSLRHQRSNFNPIGPSLPFLTGNLQYRLRGRLHQQHHSLY